MTFLEIRQRVAEMLGLNSASTQFDPNATIETKIKEWVNARYRLLCGKRSWNWLIQDAIIQTAAEVTTGTVTATNASTTITFSSAPAASATGWFIQFSDSDDWYEISSHTAAVTTATLSAAFLGTTSSTLTYTLRKTYYALPSTIGKIIDARQTRSDVALKYVSPQTLNRYVPDRTATGKPYYYSIAGLDSSRNYRMELYPVPSEAMNINIRHFAVATELSGDSDVPLAPEAFHEFLVWDTLASYGYLFLDDARVTKAKAEAKEIYEFMEKNDIATENVAVRRSFDVDLTTSTDDWLRRLDTPIEE